jgi:hypothetical protein
MAMKLLYVLSARRAMRLNSLSFAKNFSIKKRQLGFLLIPGQPHNAPSFGCSCG